MVFCFRFHGGKMKNFSAPEICNHIEDKTVQIAPESSQLLTSTNPNVHTVTIGLLRIVACPDLTWKADLTDWPRLMTSQQPSC